MNLIERRRQMMMSKSKPYDAEIEYLESTSTQYINTGYYPTLSSDLDVVVLNFGVGQTSGRFVMGTGNATWSLAKGWIFGIAGTSGKPAWNNIMFNSNCTYSLLGITTGNLYKLEVNSSGIYIDDVLKVSSAGSAAQTNLSDPFWIFKILNGGSISDYNKGKWKFGRTTIKDNGVTVVDFVPCRIGTTGYMYDRVSGQLFGNAGTGDFILGPDVQ